MTAMQRQKLRYKPQKKIWTSQWSVILRTFYRQILSLLYSSFFFWNFRHRLARELLVERFGETSFPKTTDMSVGWNVSLPFKSPMIWAIWSFDKISVLSVCFDPYRYMPSPFGCHACTRNGLHEAIVPRTWIPVRRSWPHRIHRQNYGIRTESLPAHNLITSVFC